MLWNHIATASTQAASRLYILTGSAVPSDDVMRHSGAGRFARLRSARCPCSSGSLQRRDLMAALLHAAGAVMTATDLPSPACRSRSPVGGPPGGVRIRTPPGRARVRRDDVDVESPRVGGPARPARVRRLMMSPARNLATERTDPLATDTPGPSRPSTAPRSRTTWGPRCADGRRGPASVGAAHPLRLRAAARHAKRHFTALPLALAATGCRTGTAARRPEPPYGFVLRADGRSGPADPVRVRCRRSVAAPTRRPDSVDASVASRPTRGAFERAAPVISTGPPPRS